MKRSLFYLKIWLIMAKNALLNWSTNRRVFLVFLVGKVIRYTAYFGFLYFLVRETGGFLGYSQNQVLFFTATYILIDTTAQFFFRSVYSFRSMIVSGDFDLVLAKPLNSLFRVLLGGPDPIDLITIPPIIFVVFYIGRMLDPSLLNIIYYLLLVINGLVIACAFHIFVLAFGIITMEVDHMVMVFRDLTSMSRFPVDIYKKPLKEILTYMVPIAVMITIPAKAIMGLVSFWGVFGLILVGFSFLFISLLFWRVALTKYASASS
ncbi:ABC transporter permease [Patescibacteria group bacterium]